MLNNKIEDEPKPNENWNNGPFPILSIDINIQAYLICIVIQKALQGNSILTFWQ